MSEKPRHLVSRRDFLKAGLLGGGVLVGGLLRRQAEAAGESLVSGTNLAGFPIGLAVMYLTALLVK